MAAEELFHLTPLGRTSAGPHWQLQARRRAVCAERGAHRISGAAVRPPNWSAPPVSPLWLSASPYHCLCLLWVCVLFRTVSRLYN